MSPLAREGQYPAEAEVPEEVCGSQSSVEDLDLEDLSGYAPPPGRTTRNCNSASSGSADVAETFAFKLSSQLLATGIAVVRKIHDLEVHMPPVVERAETPAEDSSSRAATGSPDSSPRSSGSSSSSSTCLEKEANECKPDRRSRSSSTSNVESAQPTGNSDTLTQANVDCQQSGSEDKGASGKEMGGNGDMTGPSPKRRRKHKGRLAQDWETSMAAVPQNSRSPSSTSLTSSCGEQCQEAGKLAKLAKLAKIPKSVKSLPAPPAPAPAQATIPPNSLQKSSQQLSVGCQTSWLAAQGAYPKAPSGFGAGDTVQVVGLVHYIELNFHFAWARSADPQKQERWIVQLWDGRQVNLPAANLRRVKLEQHCDDADIATAVQAAVVAGKPPLPLGTARLRSLSRQLKMANEYADPIEQVVQVRADLEACYVRDTDGEKTTFSGRAMALLAAARAAHRKLVQAQQCRARLAQLLQKGERVLGVNPYASQEGFGALRSAQSVLSTDVDPVSAGSVPLLLLDSEASLLAGMLLPDM